MITGFAATERLEGIKKPSSWDRRRPRLPASSAALIGNVVTFRMSMQFTWLLSTRAGGDACGPSTMAFDYFESCSHKAMLT